ncbi:uncharacterized protein LOC124896654 [Capsicum annuum]|uniref:uncharacterized protein LOC124896654 n=1 Tax=Capsicum annuum TaxID=4072 RepID=UPI001FB07AC9|nr:uncharacterized protein LOC124896654 [Capsicum annuum]
MIFIGGDFNGHIGSLPMGYDDMHGGFGFGDRNVEGAALLDFVRAFGLVVMNSNFPKKEEHLVTFCSRLAKTQIDILLLRKGDRAMCKDCKAIPSENLVTQHRLLVIKLGIKKGKKRRGGEGHPRVRWGGLTPASALEIGAKLEGMGVWEDSRDVDSMWDRTAGCIKESAKEVLGISRGWSGRYRGDWWWNEDVKKKVEMKKTAYVKLVESKDEEEKQSYFHKLLNDEEDRGVVLGELDHTGECCNFGYCRRFKVEDVSEAIRKMRRGRATGPGKISVDFWKFSSVAGLRWLTNLFNSIFKSVSALSPFLFSMVMDVLTWSLQGKGRKYSSDSRLVSDEGKEGKGGDGSETRGSSNDSGGNTGGMGCWLVWLDAPLVDVEAVVAAGGAEAERENGGLGAVTAPVDFVGDSEGEGEREEEREGQRLVVLRLSGCRRW